MKETLQQIAELIRIELLKRNFIVDVTCELTKDNKLKVKTSSFQTTPVLFKKVWIESSNTCFTENENDKGIKYTDFYVSLSVYYNHFDDGCNECDLLAMEFRKFEDWRGVRILSIR